MNNIRVATHHVILPTGVRIPVSELITPSGVYYREAGMITSYIASCPIPYALGAQGDLLRYAGWSQGYVRADGLKLEKITNPE